MRENLVYAKDFLCTCDRCQDETENETYMSAIKCTKKCPGYFLPEKPLDCESKWTCNECSNQAPQGYHEMANSKVAEAIAKYEEEGLSPEKCEKFIKTYSKVLPGISRLKGSALFELYLVMQQRGIRAMNTLDLSPEETLMILKNAFAHLSECIECLQYEPSHQAEGKMR